MPRLLRMSISEIIEQLKLKIWWFWIDVWWTYSYGWSCFIFHKVMGAASPLSFRKRYMVTSFWRSISMHWHTQVETIRPWGASEKTITCRYLAHENNFRCHTLKRMCGLLHFCLRSLGACCFAIETFSLSKYRRFQSMLVASKVNWNRPPSVTW